MFNWLRNFWHENGFEICLISSIVVIIILALFRIGKKGTWTSLDSYALYIKKKSLKKHAPKTSKGELECRRVLQKLFGKPFNKARPDFLRNPVTGGLFNLELDCYNPVLKLAVEYNGAQHYKFIPYFHKNKEAFLNQKYRDDMKRRICKDNNITLIEVPNTIKIHDIGKFIITELYRHHFFSF